MFDVFQHHWSCRLIRYLIILFSPIIMNNSIVISTERFLSISVVPHTLQVQYITEYMDCRLFGPMFTMQQQQ